MFSVFKELGMMSHSCGSKYRGGQGRRTLEVKGLGPSCVTL